jgi:hypothetical protein
MNTPETDKRVWSDHSEGILHEVVEASFARKLERERDEAREDLNNIRINLGEDADGFTLLHAVCALQNERDEAREESEQQSRLLGISAEREYALRGKIFELERKILQLEAK